MTQPNQPQPVPVWIEGDPLMEAIASAIWEQCETDGRSTVVDDPRNIAAAVAAAVARTATLTGPERQFLSFALDLAADRMAERSDEFTDEDTAALESLRRLAPARPDDTTGA